jgi:hypothetical protein
VIPKESNRLAEVDFPIALVSKHSAREKSIRHGPIGITEAADHRPLERRHRAVLGE